jgi:GNAT superfamily N-acetyltransferase
MDAQRAAVGLTIREASPDEVELLLDIQRAACTTAFAHIFPPDEYPFPDDPVREEWRAAVADPEVEVHVAEVDGEPAGVVNIGGEFLCQLYVVPGHQGTGVGSALHDLALERLRLRGNERAKLWCLEHNTNARRYYEKRGWMLTDATRVVPFPPNPLDVQYEKKLYSEAQER